MLTQLTSRWFKCNPPFLICIFQAVADYLGQVIFCIFFLFLYYYI